MSFDLIRIDSKNELKERISIEKNGIILGIESEAPRSYWLFKILDESCWFSIGVISNDLRIKYLRDRDDLIIGTDHVLYFIKLSNFENNRCVTLDGYIFDLFKMKESDNFIALHEIGVVCYSFDGQKIWSLDFSDVLSQYNFRDGYIDLINLNCSVRLSDGLVINE